MDWVEVMRTANYPNPIMNNAMNDRHLDPPDYPEPPEWYMTIEDAADDPVVPAEVKTAIFAALENWCNSQNEYDQGPEPVIELPDDYHPDEREHCTHGNKWGDCGTCDHLGDLEFDAAREKRLSR